MTGFIKKKISDSNIIGIDLGTTNTLAAIMKDNAPVVITDENNKKSIPSIVHFYDEKEIVGEEAKKFLIKDPLNTIFASKRLIGRKLSDDVFKSSEEYLQNLPYKVKEVCNGDLWVKTDKKSYSPTQIASKILSRVKEYAQKRLNKKIERAVVTVPAYFNDTQRQATKNAGKLAGLDVVRVLNEPTAAALAYGLNKNTKGNIAVYDLGGGTFDISILEVEDGIFQVKSTNGDTFLGGEDFDTELSNLIYNLFEQKEGVSIRNDLNARHKIRHASEKVKNELSSKKEPALFIENIVDGVDLDLVITREQFENVVRRVLLKTVEPCEKAIKDAGITKENIKHVVLVGGMTRAPCVREKVKEIFNIEPSVDIDPDLAVTKGAAIQAGVLSGNVNNVLLLDVIPLSLGIETLGGIYSKVINRNTTIPFKQTETFSTSEDNQKEVSIRIFQGEGALVKNNILLGTVILKDIPPAKRGEPKINVTFEADVNGILKVSAQDSINKKDQVIEIKPAAGFTDEEIQEQLANMKVGIEEKERIEFKIKVMNELNEFLTGDISLPENISLKVKELYEMVNSDNFVLSQAKGKYNELVQIIK